MAGVNEATTSKYPERLADHDILDRAEVYYHIDRVQAGLRLAAEASDDSGTVPFEEVVRLAASQEVELGEDSRTILSDAIDSRNAVMQGHTRLVQSVARFYWRRVGKFLLVDDLFQQGFLGLHKAICSFDTSKGVALSTHAMPIIGTTIRRYINTQKSLIKIPEPVLYAYADTAEVDQTADERAQRNRVANRLSVLSLNYAQMSEDEGRELIDMVADDSVSPGDEVMRKEILASLFAGAGLSDRERDVLLERYIFDKQVQEIAQARGWSGPYVSKLLRIATNKLKESATKLGFDGSNVLDE